MPKVDVNKKRGYEASVPVEKIWSKLESGEIDKNCCIPLGQNEKKEDRSIDLKRSMHILASGGALSGVGMFRRVTLATLLKFNKPEDLKFILIDPLKISLFHFKNIDKYLVFPIITENEKAFEALEWARQEVERRYQLLSESNSRNISVHNEKNNTKKIPRIVIMITELGELMNFDGKKTEGLIIRIAQMTKALGIHFIITTQRPAPSILTPLIKTNMPSRIAFKTGDEEGSLAILDMVGAEKLLGQGDMLVSDCYNDYEKVERMQGYCLEEEEVEKLIF